MKPPTTILIGTWSNTHKNLSDAYIDTLEFLESVHPGFLENWKRNGRRAGDGIIAMSEEAIYRVKPKAREDRTYTVSQIVDARGRTWFVPNYWGAGECQSYLRDAASSNGVTAPIAIYPSPTDRKRS